MNTIIEKIRAEVERLIAMNKTRNGFPAGTMCAVRIEVYENRLSFLDTLESENPMQEGLGEEIDKFLNETGAPYCWCNDDEQKDWCTIIARHFYELGRQSKPKVCEELEEEIYRWWGEKYIKNSEGLPILPIVQGIARHFAKWGAEHAREQMMKEAVEGIAVINAHAKEDGFGYVRSEYIPDDVLRGLGRFKIIIVKED